MQKIVRIFSDKKANVAVPGAVLFVAVLAMVGGTLDLMSVSNQRASLQELADSASLAAVREMAVTADDVSRIEAVALAFAESSNLALTDVQTSVDVMAREVTVSVAADPRTNFPEMMSNMKALTASATARLSGRGGNICMIGLSPEAMSTLRLKSRAKITADSCAIYSNSTSPSSMSVASTAEVKADLICVAGGYKGGFLKKDKAEELKQTMLEDCTPVADPLSMRLAPSIGTCDYTNTVVRKDEKLSPGVYCGGLIVDGAKATLSPGEYIIKEGPLHITKNGTLKGENVGFYLADDAAKLQLDYDSNISVTAPKDGVMTGLLFFSNSFADSALTEKAQRKKDRKRRTDGVQKADHYIRSDNARRLVGTIYLPSGKLLIDGRSPIADRSEYTVIIADTFELQDGPNLVLRTDYHLSDIPVPVGVGPVSQPEPRLVE